MKLFWILLFIAQTSFGANLQDKRLKSVSIMTYNLENLFDNLHDKGKNDYTYLPLAVKNASQEVQDYCAGMTNSYYQKSCYELDWSDHIIEKKLTNMAKVIKSYNSGRGADIIAFQEVENIRILKTLVNKKLRKLGYKYISLIEGPDSRGIDVAVISKYPIVGEKTHHIDLFPYSSRQTRPILEVKIKMGSKKIVVLVNHWPSQGNVDETRIRASEVLSNIAQNFRADLVIATGDFNTSKDDLLNGITENILPIFEDIEVKSRRVRRGLPEGTHWYKGEWESLDKMFVLKDSLRRRGVRVDYSRFDIINHNYMMQDLEWEDWDTGVMHFSKDVPIRFDSKTGKGFSDHLPVVGRFIL